MTNGQEIQSHVIQGHATDFKVIVTHHVMALRNRIIETLVVTKTGREVVVVKTGASHFTMIEIAATLIAIDKTARAVITKVDTVVGILEIDIAMNPIDAVNANRKLRMKAEIATNGDANTMSAIRRTIETAIAHESITHATMDNTEITTNSVVAIPTNVLHHPIWTPRRATKGVTKDGVITIAHHPEIGADVVAAVTVATDIMTIKTDVAAEAETTSKNSVLPEEVNAKNIIHRPLVAQAPKNHHVLLLKDAEHC